MENGLPLENLKSSKSIFHSKVNQDRVQRPGKEYFKKKSFGVLKYFTHDLCWLPAPFWNSCWKTVAKPFFFFDLENFR